MDQLTVELERLEYLQREVWPAVVSGNNPRAVEVTLKVMAVRAKLFGFTSGGAVSS